MSTVLDLAILDSGDRGAGVALARSRQDMATAVLPYDQVFADLIKFRDDMELVLRHGGPRPSDDHLRASGRAMFDYCIRDNIRDLYNSLPPGQVSVQIMSTRPEVQKIPWELMQAPGQRGPTRQRCIVRVVPTVGQEPLQPHRRRVYTRVLFAASDPIDQNQPVSWPEVKDSIQRAFEKLPRKFRIIVEEAVTPQKLVRVVAENNFEIFHFSGHGEPGYLILEDRQTGNSHRFSASDLANVLAGKVQLVILSACDTAAGNFDDEFGVTATTLIQSGIPAVVANQMPIPNGTVATFVGSFYEELIRSGNVDRAMSEGRIMLSVDIGSFEWGIPTLYRHFGGAQLYASET